MSQSIRQYHAEVLQLLESINTFATQDAKTPIHVPEPLPQYNPANWVVFNHLTPIPETFERVRLRGRGRGKGLIIKRKPAIEVKQLPVESAANILSQHDKMALEVIPTVFKDGFSISKAN